jgi:hypothetical protein
VAHIPARRYRQDADEPVESWGVGSVPGLQMTHRPPREQVSGLTVGVGSRQDLSRFGEVLEAVGGTDGVAHDRVVPALPASRLPRVHQTRANPKVDCHRHGPPLVEGGERVAHLQSRMEGPFHVILMGLRRSKDGLYPLVR